MVSAIDATKPEDGELPVKADFRANFLAAKNEIEALEVLDAAVRNALGLASNDDDFPQLGGDNTPTGRQTLPTILLALDTAITAAAASGGGGGATTLGEITDILSPTEAIRGAFQNPLSGTTQNADFNFELGSQGGRFITIDNSLNPVTMTLPAISALSARSDGFLCELVASSGSNFAAITAPSDLIRYQRNFINDVTTQTTVFIGLSRSSGFGSSIRIYKDGPVYRLFGPGRVTEGNDERFGAVGSLNANVLQAATLLAATFPDLLDLGGTKRAGGSRSLFEDVAGSHTFLQANAGKTLIHTGAGAETWNVPTLLPGTEIDIENEGGVITYNIQGGQTKRGGLVHAANTSAAIKWLTTGRVVLLGTS